MDAAEKPGNTHTYMGKKEKERKKKEKEKRESHTKGMITGSNLVLCSQDPNEQDLGKMRQA